MAKENALYDTKEIIEKVILVAVENEKNKGNIDIDISLDELEELVKTAGAVSVGRITQKREGIHSGHYVGKGKVEEIKIMIQALDATGVVCDDELSPAQINNLQEMLGIKIMDRTMVILDIFANRATSKEGKIQVELAQLKYRLSRLAGIGKSMSRLGGGIGTKGPGEKKLETDRRHINSRINELKAELENIKGHRELLRSKRKKTGMPVVSIVGYTNAGKSTLLNTLTDAGILAEDKLFATLDTTTRNLTLPGGSTVLITDTVGFISKLPHHLIQAFRATLEELRYCDILLHVVDASNENRTEQMSIVYKTLKDLECENIPIITAFNKMDNDNILFPLPNDEHSICSVKIFAKNLDMSKVVLEKIEEIINSFKKKEKYLVPYSMGQLINLIHTKCEVISEEHVEKGVLVEAFVNDEVSNKLEKYKM